jgi:hypothetical protein
MRYFMPLKSLSSGFPESFSPSALWLEAFVLDVAADCVGLAAFD